MEKVETTLTEKSNTQCSQKEEIFRSILTLQALLENPPGDFPDNLREDIVKGFVKIFSYIRYTVDGACLLSILFCLIAALCQLFSVVFDIELIVTAFPCCTCSEMREKFHAS